MTWTLEDEKTLRLMLERKERTHQVFVGCVQRAVEQFYFTNMGITDLVDELVENATQFRKVLEPFDKELCNEA